MKIISIDPGTKVVGYAVLNKAKLVTFGTLDVVGDDLPAKLLFLHRALGKLFRQHKPVHVAIERPFVGRGMRDALTLNAARAVAMLEGAIVKAKVHEYAPAQVKKAATGNGFAEKSFVQQMVTSIFRLKKTPAPDAADALAIALCHLNRI